MITHYIQDATGAVLAATGFVAAVGSFVSGIVALWRKLRPKRQE